MHARLIEVQFHPDRFYEGARAVELEILPLLRRERGFRQLYVLADRASGHATVLTLWSTDDDERSSRDRIDQRLSRLARSLAAQPGPARSLPVIFAAGAEGAHS